MWAIWRKIRQLSSTELLSLISWLGALAVLRYRIPYGVNHRDEAFYSAMPYSFLIGNQPYIDERTVHQNAGLLLLPLYRLYLSLAGSSDGIILFNRYLYLVYIGFTSFLAYRLVRRIVNFSAACWAAALLVSFGYFNLLALSYNSMGALGFMCGVLLTAHALLEASPGRGLFVANLFFLTAVFCYPGLVVAFLPYNLSVVAWLYWKTPRATLKSGFWGLGAAVAAALLVFVPFGFWLAGERYERLHSLQLGQGYGTLSGLAKLDFYHSYAWAWRPALLAFSAVFVLVPLACYWLRRGVWLIAPVSALLCIACYRVGFGLGALTPAMFFFMAIPVLAPVCVALNRDWPHGRFLLVLVWAPSVLSMLAVTYASSNDWLATLLGALGAVVSGIAALGALLDARATRNPAGRVGYQLALLGFAGACLGIEVDSLFSYFYDQSGVTFSSLDTRVKAGPMRGTIGTSSDAALCETIHRDLKSFEASAGSLTIFDAFPLGYLSTKLRSRTWTQWIIWGIPAAQRTRLMRETFGDPGQLPDLVLKINMEPASKALWPKYERGHYRKVLERKEFGYAIYMKTR